MSQVGISPELKAAAALIRSVGGTVHFPRPHVVVWGQEFTSLKEVADDPRCAVSYLTLFKRMAKGTPLVDAVNLTGKESGSHPVTCWGTTFPSMWELAKDERCKVSYNVLAKKISRGLTTEEAASDSRRIKPITTIEQAIVGGGR